VLAAVAGSCMAVWALAIYADGSKWESILTDVTYVLLICVAVVAPFGGPRSKSE
jgi:hypothetical protein